MFRREHSDSIALSDYEQSGPSYLRLQICHSSRVWDGLAGKDCRRPAKCYQDFWPACSSQTTANAPSSTTQPSMRVAICGHPG